MCARRDPTDTEADESRRDRSASASTALRFAAIGLLAFGFFGSLETGISPLSGESIFSAAFVAGVVFAAVSIYAGMYKQGERG